MTTRTKIILIILAIMVFAPVFFATALGHIAVGFRDAWTAINQAFPGLFNNSGG